MSDVGKSKAQAAADFIMKRVPGCVVTPHQGMVQEKDEDFYKQFKIIISGLDNIEARRWLNSLIVGMVEYDEEGEIVPTSIIPLIDGGTEGLRGQGRVILPKFTACFECTLDSFPPQQAFPMCTIAETPRLPEHCIAYVYSKSFNVFGFFVVLKLNCCLFVSSTVWEESAFVLGRDILVLLVVPHLNIFCCCVAVLEWERCFPGRKLDKDSPEDMQWVFER